MKKNENTKKQATFTIEPGILNKLSDYCKAKNLNKSQFIENAIEIAMVHEDEITKLETLHHRVQIFKEMQDLNYGPALPMPGTTNQTIPVFPLDWLLRNILKLSEAEIQEIKKAPKF